MDFIVPQIQKAQSISVTQLFSGKGHYEYLEKDLVLDKLNIMSSFLKSHDRYNNFFYSSEFEIWQVLCHQLNFTLAFCPISSKTPALPKPILVTCCSSYLICLPPFLPSKLFTLQDMAVLSPERSSPIHSIVPSSVPQRHFMIISLYEHLLIFTTVTSYTCISTADLCLA